MPATNTARRYGSVARSLHWATAILILSAIGLGLYAQDLPYDTSEALAAKAQVFSWHKTIGIAAFFIALIRILWALSQPRPAPVHPDRKLETLAAEGVHWMLYGSMLLMPLSGWIHHAAVEGFAPILWPFGQDLPFVPKSELIAKISGILHVVFSKLLIAAVLLHVVGALKHAVWDRDGTLSRMLTGREAGRPAAHPKSPAFAVLAVFALVVGGVLMLSGREVPQAAEAPSAETPANAAATDAGNWQVESGALNFTVKQMGADVQGNLPDWTAEIAFDEAATNGKHGHVRVQIDTTTLTLGSVTDQAKGAEFFDVAGHKTAVFEADILPAASGYQANGTLTLRGETQPVSLPFALTIEGDTARMQGAVTLDRRAFGMGASYGDESSVGFPVVVTVDLTARRK
ncbi:cytochrome b/b6 domain-containing protein [Gemmobacter serpentinus]|uniref:cytochrome b/b6 domain-containing protein n=1 Tax=Gemmobacter serpentinus TaxID=2652247 RepID=UPI00124BE5A4|nr:cytochrome b/b6 domain-containing protein [Gemmobacter serpentinus]